MANDYERRLMRVLDYIHDNPAGDLSLDALADVAALSRFHFHRVFRAMTGQTVAQAVRRLRALPRQCAFGARRCARGQAGASGGL